MGVFCRRKRVRGVSRPPRRGMPPSAKPAPSTPSRSSGTSLFSHSSSSSLTGGLGLYVLLGLLSSSSRSARSSQHQRSSQDNFLDSQARSDMLGLLSAGEASSGATRSGTVGG